MHVQFWEESLDTLGGSELCALQIADALHERGHNLSLLYRDAGSLLDRYERCCSVCERNPLTQIAWRKPAASVRSISCVSAAVRRTRPDVIFSSNQALLQIASVVQRVTKTPAVFHLGLPATDGFAFQNRIRRAIAAGVSPSYSNAETWLNKGWPPEKMFIVPNWVDSRRFSLGISRAHARNLLKIDERPLVVFIGRVVRDKGVEFLIRSFRAAPASAVLAIVGYCSPSYKQELEQTIIDSNIAPERVRFVGPSPNPELFLAGADVVTVPSITDESFGLSLLEAMSCAKLVVATNIAAFRALVGPENLDLLVDPNDDRALGDRLRYWIGHRRPAIERGLKLKARVEQVSNKEVSVTKYESILQSAVGRTPANSNQ